MAIYRVEFIYSVSGFYTVEAPNASKAEKIADQRFQTDEVPTYTPIDGTGLRIMHTAKVDPA